MDKRTSKTASTNTPAASAIPVAPVAVLDANIIKEGTYGGTTVKVQDSPSGKGKQVVYEPSPAREDRGSAGVVIKAGAGTGQVVSSNIIPIPQEAAHDQFAEIKHKWKTLRGKISEADAMAAEVVDVPHADIGGNPVDELYGQAGGISPAGSKIEAPNGNSGAGAVAAPVVDAAIVKSLVRNGYSLATANALAAQPEAAKEILARVPAATMQAPVIEQPVKPKSLIDELGIKPEDYDEKLVKALQLMDERSSKAQTESQAEILKLKTQLESQTVVKAQTRFDAVLDEHARASGIWGQTLGTSRPQSGTAQFQNRSMLFSDVKNMLTATPDMDPNTALEYAMVRRFGTQAVQAVNEITDNALRQRARMTAGRPTGSAVSTANEELHIPHLPPRQRVAAAARKYMERNRQT